MHPQDARYRLIIGAIAVASGVAILSADPPNAFIPAVVILLIGIYLAVSAAVPAIRWPRKKP